MLESYSLMCEEQASPSSSSVSSISLRPPNPNSTPSLASLVPTEIIHKSLPLSQNLQLLIKPRPIEHNPKSQINQFLTDHTTTLRNQ
ncbi:hypothetical protein C1H46_042778 [Malus baccata]|uniref:Uncharacterized protein n=1 Tax=Malus baccata TaxID=106549 RepID=A0A540KBU4_MALBA|nr:hypothetical protein C1H46_042778 [Malus baccata]